MSVSKLISKLSTNQIKLIRICLSPISFSIELMDFIYPKGSKTIIFGSNTGEFISGSPKALFEYIKNEYPDYRAYFYTPFNEQMSMSLRIIYIIKFIPIFLNAKFLISSHPPTDFFPFNWSSRKVHINMWHGVPLKAMFFADKGDTYENLKKILKLNRKTSAFIVSSNLEAALLTKCFLINPTKFYYLGQPRNDILMKGNKESRLKKILKKVPKFKKVILYCPTYRRGEKTKFFPFEDLDISHLNNYLEVNEIILLLRGHVYNKELEKLFFSERIVNFEFRICNDINFILNEVDILVTDYSSIYIDYLLLNRPCIFIPYDLEDYRGNRGLLLDDYDFWTPGYKVLTYKEFIDVIDNIISGKDEYETRRQEINRQFNYHQSENSCESIFRLISGWKKERHQ